MNRSKCETGEEAHTCRNHASLEPILHFFSHRIYSRNRVRVSLTCVVFAKSGVCVSQKFTVNWGAQSYKSLSAGRRAQGAGGRAQGAGGAGRGYECVYMLHGLNMLNPDAAVDTTTPGHCEWKCNSLTSVCPRCWKSICAGGAPPSAPSASADEDPPPPSAASASRDMSQTVTCTSLCVSLCVW